MQEMSQVATATIIPIDQNSTRCCITDRIIDIKTNVLNFLFKYWICVFMFVCLTLVLIKNLRVELNKERTSHRW